MPIIDIEVYVAESYPVQVLVDVIAEVDIPDPNLRAVIEQTLRIAPKRRIGIDGTMPANQYEVPSIFTGSRFYPRNTLGRY